MLATLGQFRLALLVAWMLIVQLSAAWATPLELDSDAWEGSREVVDLARTELGAPRVIASERLVYEDLKAEDGVLIIHPESNLELDNLARFMTAGGRVIVLDDFGTSDDLLRYFGITRTALPRDPVEMLRQNPQLAVAEPAGQHVVTGNVERVILNHATGVAHPSLSPLLKVRGRDGTTTMVGLAGAVEKGRLLVIGDSSVAMNAMLRFPGNRELAKSLIRYATDDDHWGQRRGRLFIVSGRFKQVGNFGERSWSDELMHNLRTFLADLRRHGLSPAMRYGIALCMTTLVVGWVLLTAGRRYVGTRPRYARRIPTVLQGGLAGHAAVIAAPSTSRVLVLLELKAGLVEIVRSLLHSEELVTTGELLAQANARLELAEPTRIELGRVLEELTAIEQQVQRDPMRALVRDAEVVKLTNRVERLVSTLTGNG